MVISVLVLVFPHFFSRHMEIWQSYLKLGIVWRHFGMFRVNTFRMNNRHYIYLTKYIPFMVITLVFNKQFHIWVKSHVGNLPCFNGNWYKYLIRSCDTVESIGNKIRHFIGRCFDFSGIFAKLILIPQMRQWASINGFMVLFSSNSEVIWFSFEYTISHFLPSPVLYLCVWEHFSPWHARLSMSKSFFLNQNKKKS